MSTRTQGFRNVGFATLEKVADRLCQTVSDLTPETVSGIAKRDRIYKTFS